LPKKKECEDNCLQDKVVENKHFEMMWIISCSDKTFGSFTNKRLSNLLQNGQHSHRGLLNEENACTDVSFA
jgi:hypothetical protein